MADRSRYVDSAETFYNATRPTAIDDLIRSMMKKKSAVERVSDTGEEGSWKHSLPRIAEVIRQDVTIAEGKVSEFRVRLGISFKYDKGE